MEFIAKSAGVSAFKAAQANVNSSLVWAVEDEDGTPIAACWRMKNALLTENVADETTLSYHICGTTQVAKFEGTRCVSASIRPHRIAVTPAGLRQWRICGELEFAHVYIQRSWLRPKSLGDIQPESKSQPIAEWGSVTNANDQWLVGLFRMLTAYPRSDITGRSRLLFSLRSAICEHLYQTYSSSSITLTTSSDSSGGLSPYDVSRARAFMTRNFQTPPSVQEIAEHVGYSRSHFTRAFTESVGCSPHHHMLKLRIDLAKTFLRTSDLPLSEIANRVGFRNPAHFSIVFSRLEGTAPSHYRRLPLSSL